MKIGVLVPGGVSKNPADGTIPVLHWIVERLARRHDVHVFTFYGSSRREQFPLLGATIHHLAGSRLSALQAIVSEHRRGAFDVLQAFWLIPPGVIAGVAGRWLRVPLLVHIAGGELVSLPEIGYGNAGYMKGRLWNRIALGSASRITAASAPILRAVQALGFTAERIPLGVDLGSWPVAVPRSRSPGDPAKLLHVGTLNRVKDQSTLIEAAKHLAEAGVAFTLDVAGPDTLGGSVERMATDVGVGHLLRFHGYLPHSRLRQLMETADLLLISSRHEAGPMVLLEAAIAGVPAVGTAVGHVLEWAPDAALAVPVGDARALADEAAGLLRDEGRRLRIAREAQRRALETDADWTVEQFERLYAAAISKVRSKDRARQ